MIECSELSNSFGIPHNGRASEPCGALYCLSQYTPVTSAARLSQKKAQGHLQFRIQVETTFAFFFFEAEFGLYSMQSNPL